MEAIAAVANDLNTTFFSLFHANEVGWVEIKPIVKEDFLVLQDNATLAEMIGALRKYEKRSALIFRNKKYLGLVQKKWLLRSRLDATEVRLAGYVQKTPIVSEHEDVISVAYLMFQSGLDFLPVERDKKIFGVLSAVDVAALAMQLPETRQLRVSDIKLAKPTKLGKDEPVAQAIAIMAKEHLEQVPIFDAGGLYGVISYRDLLRRYLNWSPRRNFSAKFNKLASSRSAEADMPHLASLPVHSFSTNDNLGTVAEHASLKDAVDVMLKRNLTDLLVLRGGEYSGLLTAKNILRRVGSLLIPKKFNIRFVGLGSLELDTYQTYNVKKICSNEAFKLQRKLHNESFGLTVHIKEYERDGKKHKYSVHLRVEFPSQIITSSQEDWDLETALRKTFANAQNAVRKQFHGDVSWRRSYG